MAQQTSYQPNPRAIPGDNSGAADPHFATAQRKVVFLHAIEKWVADRREKPMTRGQFANLDSLGRLVAQRQSLMDNLAYFYRENPNADVAPGVLALVTILSDNSDGCCTLSNDRMARFFARSPRRIIDAVSRLEGWDTDPSTGKKFKKNPGVIVVERVPGASSRIYPWIHPVFGSSKDSIAWIIDARAPRSEGKAGRPRNENTPDASVTPILITPDTGDEIPLTPVTNTPDVCDQIPLTPASPNTTTYTTHNNTKKEVAEVCEIETSPPQPLRDLVVLDRGSEVAADEQTITSVLRRLGYFNATHAQREKTRQTLTKAALQWEGMGQRHRLYRTAGDWFLAEWLYRLGQDLEKLQEAEQPRRFTERLESTIVYEAKANPTHYGSEPKTCSTTRVGANDALDKADKKYFGSRRVTVLIDFENGKQEARSQDHLPETIAKAALKRLHGDDALDIFPAEQQQLERQLAADGFPADDVKRIMCEFSEHISLGPRRKHGNFPPNAWSLLFDREVFIERALAYLRAALRCVQDERQKQKADWLRRLPGDIAWLEAKERNPDPWKNWKSLASQESRDALIAHVTAGLGDVSEHDIPSAMVRANALAEQYVQNRTDEGFQFSAGTKPPAPPEPFEFRWHKIEKYPDPFANAVAQVSA